jgi:hypothetical protein
MDGESTEDHADEYCVQFVRGEDPSFPLISRTTTPCP